MLLKLMSFLYIVLFVTIWCQDDTLVMYLWIMKKKRFFCSHQKCDPFFVSKFQEFIMLFKLVLHRRTLSTNKQTGTQHNPNMTVRKSKSVPRQGNHGSYVSCKKKSFSITESHWHSRDVQKASKDHPFTILAFKNKNKKTEMIRYK